MNRFSSRLQKRKRGLGLPPRMVSISPWCEAGYYQVCTAKYTRGLTRAAGRSHLQAKMSNDGIVMGRGGHGTDRENCRHRRLL